MGDNAAYTFFEGAVVGLYDLGKIDKKSLDVLGKLFDGCDIDHGGSRDLVAKDGKDLQEIIISVMLPKVYSKLLTMPSGTNNQRETRETREEAFYEAESRVTDRWGWC